MLKIAILGSDNSHAEIFSKIINLPDEKTKSLLFPDFRITHIFGLDKERTRQVARDGNIENIVEAPEELLGLVDAVMVVFRHGDLHKKYALPFIEAGIPTWIDKPFAIRNEDARILIQAANEHNTLLTGGSTCKFTNDILEVKKIVEKGNSIGKIKTGALNFPATLTNEYGGIYFYGAHLAEMAMMTFGYDVSSVIASENRGTVTAIVKYDRYQITLSFIPGSKQYYAVLFGENGSIIREIDITDCYIQGIEKFTYMLKSRKLPLPLEHLYKPVSLLNAIVESYETIKEVVLDNS